MTAVAQSYPPFCPGLYEHMDAGIYHADPCAEPSLSSGIANLLLTKTPAHARLAHPRLNPLMVSSATKSMSLGSVTHEILLGKGSGFEVCPFDDYRTKDARAWRGEAMANGVTPIKAEVHVTALEMAKAVRARMLDTPGAESAFIEGAAEAIVIWRDSAGGDTGTMCRAMIDWLDLDTLAIYDLKTTGTGLGDRSLQSKIAGGLDLQAAFHLRGIEHVNPDISERVRWRWVFMEDEPPFESRVVEMDAMTRKCGDHKAVFAIELWRKCLAANNWPGYPRVVEYLDYPAWEADAWLGEMHS